MKPSYEDLLEEVEWLRAELGVLEDTSLPARLRAAFGMYPCVTKTLVRLYAARGRTVQHWALMDDLSGAYNPTDTLKFYICSIRKRLGFDAVENSFGVGYRLTPSGLATIDAALAPMRRAA